MTELKGQVALVTGSSSGIGAAIARRLAADGAAVLVNSSRSAEAGQALAASLGDAVYVQGSIADPEHVTRMLDTVTQRWGRLDILVNNAGTTRVIPHADIDAASVEVWREIFEVNVFGTWQLSQQALPLLAAGGGGQIINVTSIAAHRPIGSSIPYACSKAAVDHLTRLLARTAGPAVRVNAVAPGLVDTPWTADWDEKRREAVEIAPLGRVATPGDVAQVVAGLALSAYVTGQVVTVDGGLTLCF